MEPPDSKTTGGAKTRRHLRFAARPPALEHRRLRRARGGGRIRRQLRPRSNHQQRHDRRLRRQRQRRHAPRQAPALRASPEPHRAQLGARPPNGQRMGGGQANGGVDKRLGGFNSARWRRASTTLRVTAASCRHAFNNAPVVSVNDSEPPYATGAPAAFPVAWTETASSGVESFTIHTGVVGMGRSSHGTSRSTSPTHANRTSERSKVMRGRNITTGAAGLDSRSSSCLRRALSVSPVAHAAGDQLKPIVITPSSGCSLLTAYTAGTGLPAWSSPAAPCGGGPFTLGFNQGNTASAGHSLGHGRCWDGWQRPAGLVLASVPEGARMGYQISAPPGITINAVVYDASQLQNIADGRGWIGLTYWNGGTAQVLPNGTAVDAAASGPLDTAYWGIELRCVDSQCALGQGKSSSANSRYTRPRRRARASPRLPIPSACGTRPCQAAGSGTHRETPGRFPSSETDSSGICSLSLQVGAGAPVGDPSLPPPNNSSWQECQSASWTAAVDTRDYVSGAGQLPVTLQATNATGLAECADVRDAECRQRPGERIAEHT